MGKSFDDILKRVSTCSRKRISVAAAQDAPVLEAVAAARDRGIADPILVGDEVQIRKICEELSIDLGGVRIIDEPDFTAASLRAVELVHDGEADMYMKGMLATATFLRSVLNKEVGLRTGRPLSHASVFEIRGFGRLLFLADVAFIPYPTLEDKETIINYTVDVAHACGVECPKVAPLAAVEVVNEKMPCCVDAAQLTRWNEEGRITGCIVDGPLSIDLAIDPGAARHKKGAMDRKIVGDADVLIFPDIHSGNMVYKTITHFSEFRNGAILTGTRAPVILTSRADSFETKINSIALGAVMAEHLAARAAE